MRQSFLRASTYLSPIGVPRFAHPMADDEGEGGGGGGGNQAQGFAATLPESIRGHEAFKDVKDVGDLATRYHGAVTKPFALPDKYTSQNPALKDLKSLDAVVDRMLNAERMVGLDKNRLLVMPKDASDTDALNAVYAALGRPETADGYQIGKRADGSAYSEQDTAFQKSLLPILHKAGVTQAQFDAMRPEWDGLMASMGAAHDKQLDEGRKAAETSLRQEWGAEFDDRIKLAEDALRHYGAELKLGDAITKELNASSLGNNPALAKLLVHLGTQLKEDGLLGKHEGGFGEGKTPEQAKKEIAEKEKAFRENPAFKEKNASGRAEALAEIAELYQIAYPDKSSGQ